MKTCETEIKIRGMICRACTDAVEAALLSVRGVVSAKASYFKGCAYVTYDPDICDEPTLSHSIECSYAVKKQKQTDSNHCYSEARGTW